LNAGAPLRFSSRAESSAQVEPDALGLVVRAARRDAMRDQPILEDRLPRHDRIGRHRGLRVGVRDDEPR